MIAAVVDLQEYRRHQPSDLEVRDVMRLGKAAAELLQIPNPVPTEEEARELLRLFPPVRGEVLFDV